MRTLLTPAMVSRIVLLSTAVMLVLPIARFGALFADTTMPLVSSAAVEEEEGGADEVISARQPSRSHRAPRDRSPSVAAATAPVQRRLCLPLTAPLPSRAVPDGLNGCGAPLRC